MADTILNQLIFTDNAALKADELIRHENSNLRLFIVGGSCRGFQYGFALDETINSDDIVIEKEIKTQNKTVNLIIDPISFLYLSKAEVDYVNTPDHSRFVVNNPDVKTTCQCQSRN